MSRNGLEILPVAGIVGLLILIAFITRGGRNTLAACRDALADSAKSALTVGMACAIVGSIIGMMTQTGVGTIFGSWIISLGATSLILALVITMLLSILLGTGIPTIPTYIITAALAAPALAKLGVPLIASHMFAFYYGIMADLGGGLLSNVFGDEIHEWMLKTPWMVKRFVESGGGNLYADKR